MSDSRKILAIGGPERVNFLQGLVTNDVTRISDGPVWAAMLTPQGKYLADFFLIEDGDRVLLDVAEGLAGDLTKRLSMYKLRAKVTIDTTDLHVSTGLGPAQDGAVADPRHASLGWRQYGDGDAGQADAQALLRARVTACVPESLIELIPNDSYILECGFERLHGVDFRKGCYVGQEVTARMKHKTDLRKGLETVAITGSAPVGTPITDDQGRAVGTLFSSAGDRAIAYLRFDRANGQMTAGDATIARLDA